MSLKSKIGKVAATGLLGLTLAGCNRPGIHPTIIKNEDLTGDKISDILMKAYNVDRMILAREQTYEFLFIGQNDGTYVKATKNGKYYETDNGIAYFWDGEIFRVSPENKGE
ncbi:hypothetical protein J4438_02950 [Candidatus Woesearchaeota archaeon]|nr:hypothetical protein [Candidatus Woesearchaeota archaeon]